MKTRVSTQAPWFIPGGQILGVKPGLTEVLRALDGRPPREIKAESGGDWSAIDPEVESSASVAVVSLIGPVTQYRGVCDWMFGGTSLEAFMAEIEAAASDESVRSILLLIDSPGGEAAGIADAADRIRAIDQVKPVIAFTPADCCSAAYWLASAARTIIASQTAVVGSIGVVATYIDDSKAQEMNGIRKVEFVSSNAPNKRLSPDTKEGKATIQSHVDEYADIFVQRVAALRGVSVDTVLSDFGQGGVMMGASAVNAGLADRVGTLDEAIQEAERFSSTPGTPAQPARAKAEQGSPKVDAKELKAQHPEAAAQIAAEAVAAERTRVTGILELNTEANRLVAAQQIDAALADGTSTKGDVAVAILNASQTKLAAVAKARAEDAKEVEVDESVEPKEASSTVVINAQSVYDRLNGGTK